MCERERERGWLERYGLRGGGGGGGGGRERERPTLDRCLLLLGSVLRAADGQNRRRRKLAWIPAELRASGTLAGKAPPVRAPTRGARAHAHPLLICAALGLTGAPLPRSPLWELRFSLCTFDTLLNGRGSASFGDSCARQAYEVDPRHQMLLKQRSGSTSGRCRTGPPAHARTLSRTHARTHAAPLLPRRNPAPQLSPASIDRFTDL